VAAAAIGLLGEGLIELSLDAQGEADELSFGGDIANVAVMAGRLGAPARLAGRVGDDLLGERLVAFWREAGVDVRWIRRDAAAPTGLYVNEPTPQGGHRFSYYRTGSAGSRLAPEDIDEAFLDGLALVVVSGITVAVSSTSADAAGHAASRARARGARVACVLNHRPALGGDPSAVAALARDSDIVIGSAEDALAVFGVADVDHLAAGPAAGPSEILLSNGARGADLRWPGGTQRQPAPRVRAVNAAGAGDALAGAYLAARLEGRQPPEALRWAVAAASLSVQASGCSRSYPSRDDVEAFVRDLPDGDG
jgi:2-dehydro-3-deoxygluconokinase